MIVLLILSLSCTAVTLMILSAYLENSKDIELFLNYINKAHPNTQFTVEVGNCHSLPFLDVHVSKTASGFSTSLFRKKTFTGLFSDFSSLTPKWYKFNLVNALVFRVFHICLSYENFTSKLLRSKVFCLTIVSHVH